MNNYVIWYSTNNDIPMIKLYIFTKNIDQNKKYKYADSLKTFKLPSDVYHLPLFQFSLKFWRL